MGGQILTRRARDAFLRRTARSVALWFARGGAGTVVAAVLVALHARAGLVLQGRILEISRRNDDHTDFWMAALRRFPGDPAIRRLAVRSALHAQRWSDACEEFENLIDASQTEAGDADFVIGLAGDYLAKGAREGSRTLIRSFLKSLVGKPGYRMGALRLGRLLTLCFSRRSGRDIAREVIRNRTRLERMIARSGASEVARGILDRVARNERALAETSSEFLIDTDVSRAQCDRFVALVHAKLAARKPFSFVRVGDGEAACLAYETPLAGLARGDAVARERIWWGKALPSGVRRSLGLRVFHAIWSADCIGIPPLSRYVRELNLRSPRGLDGKLTGRGLLAILHSVEHCAAFRAAVAPAPVFTSCHLHQDLGRWGLYHALLDGGRDVTLVSCHADLAAFVEREFGVTIRKNILIPPDRVSGPRLREGHGDARILPDMLNEVVQKLDGLAPGRLVLVGAGYPGKWIVDEACARGGVALDLGSVFDYWLGIATRSYLDFQPAPS